MPSISEKQKTTELRKKISIELCDNFIRRLNPAQKQETKIGALIAIRNLIKESKIDDSILLSCLVDTISDPNSEIRDMVIKVINDVKDHPNVSKEITELLEIKLKEVNDSQIKSEIRELMKD